MTGYPTEFVDELPLSADIDQSELNEHGLFVVQGLNDLLAQQLIERSKEAHVVRYCPSDSGRRFKDLAAAEAWQNRGRLALPLVRKMGDGALKLEGFGWVGPGQPTTDTDDSRTSNLSIAFAERLYQDSVGQGYALPYARAMLDAHNNLYGNNGVWLEAWVSNEAATKTYRKVGFEIVSIVSSELNGESMQRVLMALS